jgi:hypothetical protein
MKAKGLRAGECERAGECKPSAVAVARLLVTSIPSAVAVARLLVTSIPSAVAVAGLLVALALAGCGGSSSVSPASTASDRQPASTAAYRQPAIPPPDYRLTYPAAWRSQPEVPKSAFLNFLAVGRASSAECPDPLMLVRRQTAPRGTLAQALAAYERIEQLRRPRRRVRARRSVAIAGAKAAVLIEAEYPQPGVSATVHTFDLLALSIRAVAFHVFASGCAADLPAAFQQRYLLNFDAATNQPGAAPG